jgi:hypothetical protein
VCLRDRVCHHHRFYSGDEGQRFDHSGEEVIQDTQTVHTVLDRKKNNYW